MESLLFHTHSRWKLYQVVSLSTFPTPLPFCVSFRSSLCCFCTHFPTLSFYSCAHTCIQNSLIYFLLRWRIRPPAATHTHTLHYLTGAYVWASLSAWSSNIQVLAQSKQPCLRCKGYNSAGIRGRIWTGGTNKPQARLPSLSLSLSAFFPFGSPFLILSLSSLVANLLKVSLSFKVFDQGNEKRGLQTDRKGYETCHFLKTGSFH